MFKKICILVIVVIIAYFVNIKLQPKSISDGAPLSLPVQINTGTLQGVILKSRDGNAFNAFLGIPYAQPPIGSLRFESPQPAKKWIGVRNASEYGNECIQVQHYRTETRGDEDCLYLNVFSPHKLDKTEVSKNPLPVMVWIHGGIFAFGSSSMYHPHYFMDHDIILVTINYRLGAFGFLNTDDGLIRGNMGLKDQSLALQWVQQNIKQFGGDPKQVTIFGESAGGVSVHYHMLSPFSKGLFSSAISQSGVILNPWGIQPEPKKQAEILVKRLNCTSSTNDKQKVVKCLKDSPAEILAQATNDINHVLKDPLSAFVPTIEKVQDDQAFITENPSEILRNKGKINNVPWINGVNSHEGLLVSPSIFGQNLLPLFSSDLQTTFANMLWFTKSPSKIVLEKIKNYYFGDGEIQNHTWDKFDNWTDILGDTYFTIGHHKTIRELQTQMETNNNPIYIYYYSYKAQFSLGEVLLALKGKLPLAIEFVTHFGWRWIQKNVLGRELEHLGSSHFDECSLFFPLGGAFNTNVNPEHPDYQMSKELVKTWVAFAKDSNKLQFNGKQWPKLSKSEKPLKYMKLDTNPQMINQPFENRMKFWDSLKI